VSAWEGFSGFGKNIVVDEEKAGATVSRK